MTSNKNTKKIVSFVILAIVFAFVIFGIVWLAKNWEAVTSGTKLYTQEQYINFGKQEYDKGLSENEDYIKNLELLKQADKTIDELTTQLSDCEARINDLEKNNEKNSLDLITYKNQLSVISQELIEAKQKRDELQSALNAYEKYEGQLFEIKFYNKTSIHHVELVRLNNTLDLTTIPTPSIEYGTFLGWSEDNETITNETSFVITENMTFYAKFETSSLQDTLEQNNLVIVDSNENIDIVGDYLLKKVFHSQEIIGEKIDKLDIASNLKLLVDTGKEIIILDCSNLIKDTYQVKCKSGSGMTAITEILTGYYYTAEFINDSFNISLSYDYLPSVRGNEVETVSSFGGTSIVSCNYLSIEASRFSISDNVNFYLTKIKDVV